MREETETMELEMKTLEEENTGGQEGKKERVKIEMESHSRNEEFARVVAAVFMSRLNPTLEETEDVKTAVSEAVTNAIIHGYQGGTGIISMELETDMDSREFTACICDTGIGIGDIKKALEPFYSSDASGERSGMGFSFMETFMDSLRVESEPGQGTAVTMKKRIGR